MKVNYNEQYIKSGLNFPENWEGDIRPRLENLLQPLIEDSSCWLRMNYTDTTKKTLELWKKGDTRRIMGFSGRQRNMNIHAFFNQFFYDEVRRTVPLMDNERPKKSQPHIHMSLEQLWNVVCIATNKQDSMI